MRLDWPWGLAALPVVLAAAVWALRRPMQRVVQVSSLSLWRRAVEALGPSAAGKTRQVSAAWVVLLCGALVGGLALSRPTYDSSAPARRIALAVYNGAELAGLPPGTLSSAASALLDRLGRNDRVRLLLPSVLGPPGEPLPPQEARRRIGELGCLPAPAEDLTVPAGAGDVQHTYRFAPATLALADGPNVTTIALPGHPGEVTLDAFSVEPLANGQAQVFLAVRNHAARRAGKVSVGRGEPPAGNEPAPIPSAGASVALGYDLPPGGRGGLTADLPGGGAYYWAAIDGATGPGARAFAVRRRAAVRTVAMIGRDDPLVRRFVQVNPALRLVADAAKADLLIAVSAPDPRTPQPALVIDPPAPPPGWTAGPPRRNAALRDADLLAGHALLGHVDLSPVAVRALAGWRTADSPPHLRLVGLAGDALVLAGEKPPRVYVAFDLATENTNFGLSESFVIFLANVMAYLSPDGPVRDTYESLAPLQAGAVRDWGRLAGPGLHGPAPAPRATTQPAEATAPPGGPDGLALAGPLPAPGLYRDAAGEVHAVNLLGLRSAQPPSDPIRLAAAAPLPTPRPASRRTELWPVLAALAGVLWLAGWIIRTR